MLYLTRKIGESIVINDEIELEIVEIKGKSVKIGFEFPPSAKVLRREIYDRIREENKAAVGDHMNLGDLLAASATKKTPPKEKE